MRPEIRRRFDLVERQRMDIQDRVAALSDAQLNWMPKPNTWSAQQIVEHLVLSDETLGRAHQAGEVPTEGRTFRLLPRAWRRALGPLTAGQMLDLAQAHVAYHARQAEALQRGGAFPLRAAQDGIAPAAEK